MVRTPACSALAGGVAGLFRLGGCVRGFVLRRVACRRLGRCAGGWRRRVVRAELLVAGLVLLVELRRVVLDELVVAGDLVPVAGRDAAGDLGEQALPGRDAI